jgi:hypothetical protein
MVLVKKIKLEKKYKNYRLILHIFFHVFTLGAFYGTVDQLNVLKKSFQLEQ